MDFEFFFEKIGFVSTYRSEFEAFYQPYFDSERELYEFFVRVFRHDKEDKKPRQMLNNIVWFVSLARDIDKIRPGRDPLRILFLRICLESLCKITGINIKTFFNSFSNFFSEEGKQYILFNFRFVGIDIPMELTGLDRILFNTHSDYELTISDFMNIIRTTRNLVVHYGDYWTMQFFAGDTDSVWLTSITTDEAIISCQMKKEKLTYSFHTTMQYIMFEYYFVQACINFLESYIKKNTEFKN